MRTIQELLYQAIRELEYVRECEDLDMCASAVGEELIKEGMQALCVTDLSGDTLRETRFSPMPVRRRPSGIYLRFRAIRLFLVLVYRKTGYFPPGEDTRISPSTAWSVAKMVWLE